ncbi:DUF6603 domain-containing protein [Streptomyces sp. A012304]|uniref:DUF6603 domain-containing protein n=1 Tax=Streptomyces sp. A012304 TaxID=375446 RepID=UPI00222E93CB|nr:DUF6603 domain-containing protein [Streptomyces sp. A012304]
MDSETVMSLRGNLALAGARWNGREVEVRFPVSGGLVTGVWAGISLPLDIGLVDSGADGGCPVHVDTSFLPRLGASVLVLRLETRQHGRDTSPFAGIAADLRLPAAAALRLVSSDSHDGGREGPVRLDVLTLPSGTDGDGDPGATVEDLLRGFGVPLDEAPPDALRTTLTGLWADWDPQSADRRLIVHGKEDNGPGTLLLGSVRPPGGGQEARACAVMCAQETDVRLSRLPLVGGGVPEESDITVGYHGSGTLTAPMDAGQMDGINQRTAALAQRLGFRPMAFPRDLRSGGPWSRTAGWTSSGDTSPAESLGTPQSPDGATRPVWKDVSKRLGKLYVRRIGISYEDPTLWLLVDGSLGLGPLDFEAVGLGIGLRSGSPPAFRLDGLGVGFKKEPFALSGGLIWNSSEPEKYDMLLEGGVIVSVPELDLEALAAYVRSKDPEFTSMFAFVRAGSSSREGSEAPVGIGVPPVLVTGFCIGFGYNYQLRLPTPEEVLSFPLLKGMAGNGAAEAATRKEMVLAAESGAPVGPLDALEDLADWTTPEDGAYWGVLGAEATVFEKLDIWAVVPVTFGRDGVSAAVIGLLGGRFPQKQDPLGDEAYIDVRADVIAEYASATGLLAIGASVAAQTVVMNQKARVTGNLCLYVWLGGGHSGEFVFTMGGYHPGFQVPDHYPKPSGPLALDFSPSDLLTIRATAYLALSPGWCMVGGALEISAKKTFPGGFARVWGDASFDAMIDWHPFHLVAGVGLSVGAEVKFLCFHPKLELSLSLNVWLPPFGGEATAHLPFGIDVSLGFGAPKSDRPSPLTWRQFIDQQLPARAETRLRATPSGGMQPLGGPAADEPGRGPEADTTADADASWIVAPHGFSFTTDCAVPSTAIEVNGNAPDGMDGDRRLDVRPMGADHGTGLRSFHTVTIIHHGDEGDERVDWRRDGWIVELLTGGAPAALWGPPLPDGAPPPTDAGLVPDRYTGVRVTVPPAALSPAAAPLAVSGSVLDVETPEPDSFLPLGPDDLPPGDQPAPEADPTAVAVIADGIADDAVAARRNGLARLLTDYCPSPLACDPLVRYARRAGRGLHDAQPLLLPRDNRRPAQEAGSPR